mmetsp:Transcript_69592/g.123134  ORF Transcript_69592/g.123134 Transcript_69592/m.123134 type:complete len:292 (+) Transcript_69592:283-1158(+)
MYLGWWCMIFLMSMRLVSFPICFRFCPFWLWLRLRRLLALHPHSNPGRRFWCCLRRRFSRSRCRTAGTIFTHQTHPRLVSSVSHQRPIFAKEAKGSIGVNGRNHSWYPHVVILGIILHMISSMELQTIFIWSCTSSAGVWFPLIGLWRTLPCHNQKLHKLFFFNSIFQWDAQFLQLSHQRLYGPSTQLRKIQWILCPWHPRLGLLSGHRPACYAQGLQRCFCRRRVSPKLPGLSCQLLEHSFLVLPQGCRAFLLQRRLILEKGQASKLLLSQPMHNTFNIFSHVKVLSTCF